MIYPGTLLAVSDNSGAKKVLCIRIMYSKKKFGILGDVIKVSVKKCLFNSRVKKGNVYNALIVNTKYRIKRNSGFNLKFDKNSVIILDDKLEIISSRIFGLIPKEFKNSDFRKLISLADYVI
ncbi:50S ribosomal protein L14 [Candidatus Vidania fulgoroideorum]